MRVLELFAGTRSIGKAFESHGHEVISIDWNVSFDDCIHTDAYEYLTDHGSEFDIIWTSPDCTTYSIAGGSYHRLPEYQPKTDYAKYCDRNNEAMFKELKRLGDMDKIIFVENPRCMMRKMKWADTFPYYTVTYCQYGDFRMKPTDIWTNHPNPRFKPPCKNGMSCHVSAPRGSRTGTQGLDNERERESKDTKAVMRTHCKYM